MSKKLQAAEEKVKATEKALTAANKAHGKAVATADKERTKAIAPFLKELGKAEKAHANARAARDKLLEA